MKKPKNQLLHKTFETKFDEYLDTVSAILESYDLPKDAFAELAEADRAIKNEIEELTIDENNIAEVITWAKYSKLKEEILDKLEDIFQDSELDYLRESESEIEIKTINEQTEFDEFKEQLYAKRN